MITQPLWRPVWLPVWRSTQGNEPLPPSPPEDTAYLPLTFDTSDSFSSLDMIEQGVGTAVTPDGFLADGYQARLVATSIPDWLAPSDVPLSLQASLRVHDQPVVGSPPTATLVHLGDDTASATPAAKLALRVAQDFNVTEWSYVELVGRVSGAPESHPLFRPTWRFENRFPLLTANGATAKPQALFFQDSTTLIVTANYNDIESKAFRIDLTDMSVTGEFSFGATYLHVAAMDRDSAGNVWCTEYLTNEVFQVDLDASFTAGTAQITAVWDTSALTGMSSLAFRNIGGTDYVLLGQHGSTSGQTYHLYVVPESAMGHGAVWSPSNRYKRFDVGHRNQGMVVRNGDLYVFKNEDTDNYTSAGWVERFDGFDTRVTGGADGTKWAPDAQFAAPSEYPEDAAVHPTTGDIWTMTEGWEHATGAPDNFLAIWSSPLDGSVVENTVNVEYDGTDQVAVKLNGEDAVTLTWALDTAVSAVSIGAPPALGPGSSVGDNGYVSGYVRGLRLQSLPITRQQYLDTLNGTGVDTLDVYPITLTNPDAEMGNTTGWTDEVGALDVRSALNPAPYQGQYYFFGGPHAQTIASQRFDLLAQTGLTAAEVDGDSLWASVRWAQNNWSEGDVGACGLRFLDGDGVALAKSFGGLITTSLQGNENGEGPWYQRPHAVGIPAGTREIDVLYRADRSEGTNNDAYVDAITVDIFRGGGAPAGGDPGWINVISLLEFNQGDGATDFVDVRGIAWTSMSGAAVTSTDSHWGNGCLSLDGNGQRIVGDLSSHPDMATDDFTIEFWYKRPSLTQPGGVIDSRPDTGFDEGLLLTNPGANPEGLALYLGASGSGWDMVLTPTASMTANVWQHIAITREGDVVRLFLDGNLLDSGNLPAGAVLAHDLASFNLGGNTTGSSTALGEIDEWRVTLGVARYTVAFTPPSEPYPTN